MSIISKKKTKDKPKRLFEEKGLGLESARRPAADENLDVGNILKACGEEIDKLTVDVSAFKKSNLLSKFTSILKKSASSAAVAGDDLYKIHQTKVAEKVLKRLHGNPADVQTRLELIHLVRKSGKKLSYEEYKTMFIQANVACNLGILSPVAVQVVITVQERFFGKLGDKCTEEISWLESKLSDAGSNEAYQSQVEQIREQITKLNGTLNSVKAFQKQTQRGLQGKRETPGVHIDSATVLAMEDIQNFVGEETSDEAQRDEEKKAMIKKARGIAFAVRYTPFLHKSARQMLTILAKLEPEKPMAYFFQARICMTGLNLAVSHYQGERKPELAKKVQETFKETYQLYSTAVSKIGPNTSSSTDFTILIEFANLVHYYYKIATNLLGVKPPKDWLKNVFEKAQEALRVAHESGKAEALLNDIQKDMRIEGINVS